MIWHIIKKDLRLLWPMAAAVGLTQCLTAGLLSLHGQFERGVDAYSEYGWLSNYALPVICLLGLVILTVAVVQQDRLPGATQDWLTRPIPRGQLLAAKMAFTLVIGLGPVLASDVASGILESLPLHDVIAASLTRTLVLYGVVCLPAFLIGIVTRSLTEALVFSLAVLVVIGVGTIILAQTGIRAPLMGSGFAWTILLALLVMNVVAVMVLLPLQLRWRGTTRVRWIAAGYLCAAPVVIFLPWSAGYGLQQALSGHGPQLAFSVGADSNRKVTFASGKSGGIADQVGLALPVSVSPSAPNQVWQLDYALIRLVDPTTGHAMGSAQANLAASRNGYSENLMVSFPVDLFHAARGRSARINATLFMTTFSLESTSPVTQLRLGSVDKFSRCTLGYDEATRCVSTRPVGTCIEMENPGAPNRLPPGFTCRRTPYMPWPLPLWRDPYYTFVIPEWDATVVALREMQRTMGEEHKETRVLRNYTPGTHFTRRVDFALSEATEQSVPEPRSRDGTGTAARFAAPAGMTADSHGNVFVVDQFDSIVRKVTSSGEVTTFAGQAGRTGRSDGQGRDALFDHPGGIAVDARDNLYVADSGNALVRKISPAGAVTTVAGGTGSPGPASGSLRLIHPTGVICASDGSLYVIDRNESGGAVVLEVLPGGVLKAIAGPDAQSSSDERQLSPQVVVEEVSQ